MELQVYTIDGSEAGRSVTLDESVFGIEPNDHVLWLEVRRIHPASIPGLLPMFLGVAITIVAGLQLWGLLRRGSSNDEAHVSGVIGRSELLKLLGLVALCAAYALFLVGRIHFWAASSLFVASFIIIFECSLGMPRKAAIFTIARAVVIAVVFGGALSYLFEDLFLVRLP